MTYERLVEDYAHDMKAGVRFPPVVVFYDGVTYWLADGFHRVLAAIKAGVKEVEADIRRGGKRDAILYAAGANDSHGLRRTQEDKRRAVLRLLEDPEWSRWSDREIGRHCKVDGKTVASLRISSVSDKSETRKYKTRHGTEAEMKVEKGRPGRPRNEDRPVFVNGKPAPWFLAIFYGAMDEFERENASEKERKQTIAHYKALDEANGEEPGLGFGDLLELWNSKHPAPAQAGGP
jgi:hypothetical protein